MAVAELCMGFVQSLLAKNTCEETQAFLCSIISASNPALGSHVLGIVAATSAASHGWN